MKLVGNTYYYYSNMYFLLISYTLIMVLKVLSHFIMKIFHEIFQRRSREILQNFNEIFEYFKVKYFIVHP